MHRGQTATSEARPISVYKDKNTKIKYIYIIRISIEYRRIRK